MEGKRKKINYVDFGRGLCNLIVKRDLDAAKSLATYPRCDVNFTDRYGRTSLTIASANGYSDVVKVLIRRPDLLINHQTQYGETALINASTGGMFRGRAICVDLLVNDPRTDVNLVNRNGESALWHAYYFDDVYVMKLLISHGAIVDEVVRSVPSTLRSTPLSVEATEVIENWKFCLPEFTRFAKSNKYYPIEFKKWAFNFILCCLRSRSFPKDIIHLLLEYIARAWKRI